jgi:hypothetical protein
MVRWSFKRAEFLRDLDDIRNPVQIPPSRVLAQIALPDSEFDDSFISPAYIQAAARASPLCGHEEEEELSNEEESGAN